eukprot:SAG31_NODE_3041_length_4753_cov_44.421573_3_plen_164_part_00
MFKRDRMRAGSRSTPGPTEARRAWLGGQRTDDAGVRDRPLVVLLSLQRVEVVVATDSSVATRASAQAPRTEAWQSGQADRQVQALNNALLNLPARSPPELSQQSLDLVYDPLPHVHVAWRVFGQVDCSQQRSASDDKAVADRCYTHCWSRKRGRRCRPASRCS